MRLTRLCFILRRTFCLSLLITIFFQLFTYFSDESIESPVQSDPFWKNLFDQDQDLTDEERIKFIQTASNSDTHPQWNWTHLFLENYRRKSKTLDDRDRRTSDKILEIKSHSSPNLIPSTIQVYEETTVFGRPKFCALKQIVHPQCPYQNCRWTCDKAPINTEHQRRAHVFHFADIKEDEMAEKRQHRSPEEIWILWIDEANHPMKNFNVYQFNWTLSFRLDSEASLASYGLLLRKPSLSTSTTTFPSPIVDFLRQRSVSIDDLALEHRIYTNFRYRARHALWFVSNCLPQRRLQYYQHLRESYPVRAFGLCVESKCDRNDPCQADQSALAMFYLSFESQTCTDYVTEKFWKALSTGMIPIVLGPSKQSYLDLNIPSSAFIHVDDFPSAKALASHLRRVGSDYELYRSYFQWKKDFESFSNIRDLEPIRMCELCIRLNLQSKDEYRWYSNIDQWHRTGC